VTRLLGPRLRATPGRGARGPPKACGSDVAGAAALLRLLGRTVATAGVGEGGSVRLDFDDGSLIEVLDSKYESCQINLGTGLIVV
jgi:hypothetical protein